MATPILKKIPSFPVSLEIATRNITQFNKFGFHTQYVVVANKEVELASFMNYPSAVQYRDYLMNTNFKDLMADEQGRRVHEILYELFQRDPLNKLSKDSKGGIIIPSLINKKFDA